MSRRLTVDTLIADVRSKLDEDNEANIDDVKDIIPALNRAQDVAANILARHYESPLIATLEFIPEPGVTEFPIPEDALEERLEKVEVQVGDYYHEVPRVSYRDVTSYDYSNTVTIPQAYAVIGNQYRLLPNLTARYPLRIWYSKDVEPLVKPQGRIVSTTPASNYLTLNNIPEDTELTTDVQDLDAYVNLIDGNTGAIKASLQVLEIDPDCNRVTFKSTPDRTEVLGRTIVGEIPTTVEPDDFICLIHGSCIPVFKKPNSNFLIQHATADIKINKLGETGDMQMRLVDKLEQQVERSWVGRESTRRVKHKNSKWMRSSRRRWGNR